MMFRIGLCTACILFWITGLFAQIRTDSNGKDSTLLIQFRDNVSSVSFLNLTYRRYEFRGTGTDTVIRLPDKKLALGSEEIRMGRIQLIRERDYRINYFEGEIIFLIPPAEGEILVISYRRLPFELKTFYQRRDRTSVEWIRDSSGYTKTAVFRQKESEETPFLGSSRLTGSGSIMRGITIGSNQEFSLNSGLNIQISGQLTDDVTIEASLTDESTPIQPEGNTETLQEIDKVYIEIRKADRYAATFGDFDFQLQGTEFGHLSRKLQGVKASANTEKIQLDLTYASSKGRYASNILTIAEGVQGPYALTGTGGERNIIVIAGTEKVWLNGVLLRRGEDQDYIMDYSAAQIFFTRRRLITPESRVVVDFEYTEEIFRRITTAGKIQTQWADSRLRLGAAWIYDYDDKHNPINLTLPREVKDSLSRIRDHSISAGGPVIYVSGAVWVGSRRGAYLRIPDPESGDSIFVYTGADSAGNYNVRFSYVGEGRGDYVRGLILGEFRYVGKNRGDYQPVIPMTLPVRHSLGTAFVQAKPLKAWSLYAEMAISGYDVNAYSPEQFIGKAGLLTLLSEKQKLSFGGHHLGEIDLQARIRAKDSLFTETGRLNPAEFNRDWNIANTIPNRSQNREWIQEARIEYRPVSSIRLAPYYGLLKRGVNDFSSEKKGGLLAIQYGRWPTIQYQHDRITTKQLTGPIPFLSTAHRHTATTRYSVWKLVTGLDIDNERIRNQIIQTDSVSGTEYTLIRALVDVKEMNTTQFGFSYEQRSDWWHHNRQDSLNGLVSIASTARVYWNISNWKNLNTSTEYILRRKSFQGKFRTANNPDNQTMLIHSTVDYSALERVIQMSLNYQVSEEQIQNRRILFIPVGANQGNFIRVARDSFVQVPQGQGDWIQGSVRTNQFTPVVDFSAGFRLRIEPYRWNTNPNYSEPEDTTEIKKNLWDWVLQHTAWESFVRVEENQKNPDWSFYLMNFRQYLRSGQTLRGTILFRQDLLIFPRQTERGIRLRYERQENLSDLMLEGRDRRWREIKNIRWREQWHPRVATETEVETEKHFRRSSITYGSVQPDFTINRSKLSPTLFYRPWHFLELSLRGQWISGKERIRSRRLSMISLIPEVTYAIQTRGRVTANMELVRTRIQPASAAVPYELTDGNLQGTTYRWLLFVTYRIGDHLSSGLNYTGRKEPHQPVVHIASAEIRAFF